MFDEKICYSTDEAAELLSMSLEDFCKLRDADQGPVGSHFLGEFYYERKVLKKWLKRNREYYPSSLLEDEKQPEIVW